MRPAGSNSALISSNARVSRGPNCHATHSLRTSPSPCSPGERALVFAHHRARLLGDRAHLRGAVAPHVEDRPHVQRADRRVRVPRAARAVLAKHLRQAVDVIGEVSERDRAILDERHRLAVAAHAHHDVEARPCAPPTTPFARRRRPSRTTRSGNPSIAHQRARDRRGGGPAASARFAHEFDQQDRLRLADERRVDDRPERRIAAREVDHRPVDQLHRRRPELDDDARAFHRAMERRKVDDAERAMPRQRRELQASISRVHASVPSLPTRRCAKLTLPSLGVGSLAQRMEDVDVVAADPAQHLSAPWPRFRRARGDRSRADPRAARAPAAAHPPSRASGPKRAVVPSARSASIASDVVHHVAVGDRARSARVVAGHAAQRRLRRRADVDRKPQAVRLQPRIERVEDDAGLDGDRSRVAVERRRRG